MNAFGSENTRSRLTSPTGQKLHMATSVSVSAGTGGGVSSVGGGSSTLNTYINMYFTKSVHMFATRINQTNDDDEKDDMVSEIC